MRATPILALLLAGCASSPQEPATAGPLRLEMHNVQDLVVCVGDWGKCDIQDHPQGCNRFVASMKSAFPKAPWDDEGWALVFQNGLLIVRATEPIQQAVLAHVTELRKALPEEE